jgi:hypothetical protein
MMVGSEVEGRGLGLRRWRFLVVAVVVVVVGLELGRWERRVAVAAATAVVRSSKRCRWALMRCRRFVDGCRWVRGVTILDGSLAVRRRLAVQMNL